MAPKTENQITVKSIEPVKIPFMVAILGVCMGTRIFRFLLGQSLIRTALHILLLIFISGFFIGYAHMNPIVDEIKKISQYIDTHYGEIYLTDSGIFPSKTPDSIRSHFALTSNLWFDYFANDSEYSTLPLEADKKSKVADKGIVWDSKIILYWEHIDNEYSVYPLIAPLGYQATAKEKTLNDVRNCAKLFTASQIDSSHYALYPPIPNMQQVNAKLSDITGGTMRISLPQFVDAALNPALFLPLISMIQTVQIFVLVLFLTLLFSASSFLFQDAEGKKILTFSRLWIMTLYSAVPAIIIATIWDFVGLKTFGLDYSQILLYGILVYSFVVQFKLQRQIYRKPTIDLD